MEALYCCLCGSMITMLILQQTDHSFRCGVRVGEAPVNPLHPVPEYLRNTPNRRRGDGEPGSQRLDERHGEVLNGSAMDVEPVPWEKRCRIGSVAVETDLLSYPEGAGQRRERRAIRPVADQGQGISPPHLQSRRHYPEQKPLVFPRLKGPYGYQVSVGSLAG